MPKQRHRVPLLTVALDAGSLPAISTPGLIVVQVHVNPLIGQ